MLVGAALVALIGPWLLPIGLGWRVLVFVAAVLVLSMLAGMRGWVCARAFATALFSPRGKPTRLDAIHTSVDHVICACDLHAGEHVYFSGRFVCAYRYGLGGPADFPLHDAVHASAAYPGGFPARWFPTGRHGFREPGDQKAAKARYMVLVDGGAYDNLGDEWAQGVRDRNARWRSLEPALKEPSELVVVNSSAAMSWGALGALRIPLLGEALTLKRDVDVLYDTTTSVRRRWLFDTFVNERGALRGAIVQISQSPFRIPKHFAQTDGDERARAEEVLARLGETEKQWEAIVRANRAVKTTLSKLGDEAAESLVLHGYVLAMANLHTILGYPLLDVPPRERFERLVEDPA